MKRHTLLCSAVLGASALSIVSTVNAAGKPNILYILTDDQRYDSIQAFNRIIHKKADSPLGRVESPNVDRLAAEGTTFINTYVHAQGCAPSRASMHTGRYPHRSGVYAFEWHNKNAEHWKPMMPENLKDLGYQTTHIGKMGVRTRVTKNGRLMKHDIGYQVDFNFKELRKAGMTDWRKDTATTVLDGKLKGKKIKGDHLYSPDGSMEFTAPELNSMKGLKDNNKKIDTKYDLLRMYTKKEPKTFGKGEIIGGVSPQPADKTRDAYYSSLFVDYLNRPKDNYTVAGINITGPDPSKPLFVHIGYDFPHTPVLPPKSFRDKFKKYKYKVPKFNKKELNTLPPQLKKLIVKKMSDDFSDAEKQQMIQDYFAFCAYGDELIGQAYDAFVKYSEKNNQEWMVVYVCGDHGWRLNEHGSISKFSPWKIDSLNPIIVISSDKKKFPSGKVVSDLTEFVDIHPTVIAAAGADLSDKKYDYLDGYDLAKVASGELDERQYLISESHHVTGPRATIRTKNFMFSMKIRKDKKKGKNMNWAVKAPLKQVEPVMYNLAKDPNELNNIAYEKEYEKVLNVLRQKLQNVVLGDGRVEVDWGKKGDGQKVYYSDFAPGSDDKKFDFKGKL